MSYPDGMTKRDWQHIDGEQHHPQCPMHEDNYGWHECDDMPKQTAIEWDKYRKRWRLVLRDYLHNSTCIINGCPWCLEELTAPRCTCQEIDDALKEDAELHKGGL